MTSALRGSAWDRLDAPRDVAETVRRARERSERLSRGRRGPIGEAAVPHFARIAGDGRRTADWIASEVALVHGAVTEVAARHLFTTSPEARDALCYWLLGLTSMASGDVARACRLGGEREAAAAMRRHAGRTGFPVLDLKANQR